MVSGVSRLNIRTWGGGKVMELTPLYRCVAALDVHLAKLTVCVLREEEDVNQRRKLTRDQRPILTRL